MVAAPTRKLAAWQAREEARALAGAAAEALEALARARFWRMTPLRPRTSGAPITEGELRALAVTHVGRRDLAVLTLEALIPHAAVLDLDAAELGLHLAAIRDGAGDEQDDRTLGHRLARASRGGRLAP